MTENDYIKHLARVAENVTAAHGGSSVIHGRKAWVYWPTSRGTIVSAVWLGRLDENERLRPRATIVTGPSVTGDFEEVDAILLEYRNAATILQRIVNRLHEDAVEWEDAEDIEEDDIITDEDESDEDSLH